MTRNASTLIAAAAVALSAGARAGEVEQALERKVDVAFADTPFETAVRYVARRARFNVVFDRQALGREPIKVPINFRVDGIPAGEAIRWLSRIAGVHYDLGEKALLISSKAAIYRKRTVLKLYDIHDLTRVVPDFPGPDIAPEVMGGYAGAGLCLIGGEERDLSITAEGVAELIVSTVRPEDWAPELGTSIEERGGRLVVMALPEMHEEIRKLLDHIRKVKMHMIAFHVRAVRAPAATVERALAMASPDGTLRREAERPLLDAVKAEPGRLLASTRFTGLNGQRIHSWGGRQTNYVNDFEISGESYDPVVTTLLGGLQADVRSFASDDGGLILLELRLGYADPDRSELSDFRPVGPELDAEGEKDGDAKEKNDGDDTVPAPGSLQQPRVPLTQLKTTVRVRSGATVAFSASSPVREPGAGADADEIVFLVTATSVTF
ncbi:MAG: hypothetical protein ACYTFI_27340 [Planctomycetota bacterium]|jgi:hypothetical protein